MTANNCLHFFLVNTVLNRQLHLYWQSFKVFTKNHSFIELWAIHTLQEEDFELDPLRQMRENADQHTFPQMRGNVNQHTFSQMGKNIEQDTFPEMREMKMKIHRKVSTGFPSHFAGGCFTLKMYLSRFTQLLLNVSLETEICPCCFVLLEQPVFKNLRTMQIENFLPPPYSFLFFFRSFKSNFVEPFFPNTLTFQKDEKCSICPGGFE